MINSAAAVNAFQATGDLRLVRDLNGQPIVFAIGDDQVLSAPRSGKLIDTKL
jgi:hypothetical protein